MTAMTQAGPFAEIGLSVLKLKKNLKLKEELH